MQLKGAYGHPPGSFPRACMGYCLTGEPGRAPPPWHQHCYIHMTEPLDSLCTSRVQDTVDTLCTNCPHTSAEHSGCWAWEGQPSSDPWWAASETKISLHTKDRHSLPSHTYTWCQKPGAFLVCPHHRVNGFLSYRPEVFTGLKRERENDTNAGAFYSTLSQPPTCLHHWWSIRDRHLQIKDEVMETFFWNTVMESHCKNNQELEIYRACSKYDTSQIKLMHTTKFSLNPLSLLIPHALYSVCSLSDLFSSVISKEQMGVLYIHSPLSGIQTSSEYFWPPVHSSSLMFQYPVSHLPTFSYMLIFWHLSQSIIS